MKTYPINLVLADRLVVLVGAKGEIVHKIPGLLECGAHVRVIAPTATAEVEEWATSGQIEWLRRPFRTGDLDDASVVFANTRDSHVHDQVWAEGKARGQLVNVMDVVHQCNFYGVSFMRRGLLTIAIGTGGAAPALAVTIRRKLEAEYGDEYGAFLDLAKGLRPRVAAALPPFKRRVQFWYALVDSPVLGLLAEHRHAEAHALVDELLATHVAQAAEPALV
jgi:precorrin-2 dehydrogenase/sirohydrochlorin ferrochelatase